MVPIKLLAVAILPVVPQISAHITGFTAPPFATAGSSINATLRTSTSSQKWHDFSIIWGLTTLEHECDTCVSTQVGYVTLAGTEGAHASYPHNFTLAIMVPSDTRSWSYALKAAIPWLIGVSLYFILRMYKRVEMV